MSVRGRREIGKNRGNGLGKEWKSRRQNRKGEVTYLVSWNQGNLEIKSNDR